MYERKPVENPVENQVQDMPERMTLDSMDIAAEKREQLKQLFPEVFNEDKVDFERLQRVLGEQIDTGKERYGLTWPGKAECMKVIQEPSRATLKPCREESVNFDDTENLFIEGDNLESAEAAAEELLWQGEDDLYRSTIQYRQGVYLP